MPAKTETHTIHCGERTLTYLLTRKSVKNVNLRIKSDGQILVSAHRGVPLSFINAFIRRKQEYIFAVLDKYAEKQKKSEQSPRQYINGDPYYIWGKVKLLKVEKSKLEAVAIDGEFISLKVKDPENFRHKELMFKRWQKEYQRKIFEEICRETYKSFVQYGISYPEIKIRTMTSRWGSCQPGKAIITLNSKLVELPIECIEYVALHEFAHFIHPNHSKQFWELITRLMPDWKERRKKLEEWS